MVQTMKMLIALCLMACGAIIMDATPTCAADGATPGVVLSEEAASPSVKRYEGSITWSTGPSAGPGARAGDLTLRADVQIPDDAFALTLTMRRNADTAVGASHIVTLEFRPSAGFAGGGIGSVPGILLKAHLGAKALAGRVVKVDDRTVRIELSDDAAARAQNLQLLADSGWLTIVMIYSDGRHAELMLYKGAEGREAVARAIASWN
jgi:hypothetical protein